MLLASGEILQRGPIALLGQSAQIHLQSFQAELDAGFVRTLSQHLVDFWMLGERLDGCFGVRTRRQQIQIADRLLAAAQAARGRHRFDARDRLQKRDQFVGHPVGEAQQKAPRPLPICGDPAKHFFLELRAHARQLAQFLFLADLLQTVDGRDPVMLEQGPDPLRTQSLDLQ